MNKVVRRIILLADVLVMVVGDEARVLITTPFQMAYTLTFDWMLLLRLGCYG